MTKEKGIPQIRFSGFTDTWEQREVSNVAMISTGGTPSTAINEYWNPKQVPWLSSGEVHKKYITYTDDKISNEGLNHSSARMIKQNSVLIALAGQGKTRGTVAINRISLSTNQSIAAMTFAPDICPEFVFSNLESRYDELRKVSSGDGTRGGLNKQLVSEIQIPYTSLNEQRKIGQFFTHLDRLITLHQRKYDKLTKVKKAMLEKMFPKNGSLYPEIRFKGFTDAWEQRKAKDLCSISTGKSNTQDRVDDGIYPFYVRSPIVEHSNRYLFDEEAVLTVGDGVGTGKVFHYVNGKYDLHQRVYRMFDFSEEITAKYFYYYFSNHFYDRVMAMTAKTSVDSVRYEMIADMDIALPKVKEQMAISAYFDRLDHLITLHQRELEKLQNIKKSMLEKMFV